MATTKKPVMTAEERIRKIELFQSFSEPAQKCTYLNLYEAAIFLGYEDDRSLSRERTEAERRKTAKPPIPLDMQRPMSIPSRSKPKIGYSVYHLLAYLARLDEDTGTTFDRPEHLKGPQPKWAAARKKRMAEQEARIAASAPTTMARSFMDWTQTAMPKDKRAFSIQPDGTPLDLNVAIVEGKLGGNARLMTLSQYGKALATGASTRFANREREIFIAGIPEPEPKVAETSKAGPMGAKKKDKRTL